VIEGAPEYHVIHDRNIALRKSPIMAELTVILLQLSAEGKTWSGGGMLDAKHYASVRVV
jgi:hypothetical protein